MLETVKSRRIYGFLILTVLPGTPRRPGTTCTSLTPTSPASFAVGYFLKEQKDDKLEKVATAPSAAPLPASTVEDRIRMLRRQQAELERERKEVVEKLKRVQLRDGEGSA